jgi:hypothetical protein
MRVLVIGEEWRPVPSFPGYEVSNRGRVRSLKHRWGVRNTPKILSVRIRPDGRSDVKVCLNGKECRPLVHRLVLEAFVGPCPAGLECLHIDGNPQNFSPDNLRWGTRSENMYDQTRLGEKDIRGARNPNYKHGRYAGRNRREQMQKWREQRRVAV